MKSRTQKILQLAENLFLPKYETTKGLCKEDQDKAIEAYALITSITYKSNKHQLSSDNDVTSHAACGVNSSQEQKISDDDCSSKSSDEYVPSKSDSSPDEYETAISPKNGHIYSTKLKSSVEHNITSSPPQIRAFTDFTSTDIEVKSGQLEENVVINAALKTKFGKRLRNKRHYCYFCQKPIIHIAKHLEVLHEDEVEVAQVLATPKHSTQRKAGFSEIVRAGDFFHNCNVHSLKSGELVLVRRPTPSEIRHLDYCDYGPCPYCLGYMLKKHLWHHIKTSCTKKNKDSGDNTELNHTKHIIAESNAILNCIFGAEFSFDFKTYIINHLRDDKIGHYCQKDCLILMFGFMLFEKHGITQSELIRQNMRQLARLTLKLKETTKHNVNLAYFLIPEQFDIIVEKTKVLCGAQKSDITKRPQFQIPSLALKLGYALKKCANLERGVALRRGDLNKNNTLLSFLTLMDLEWCTRISSNALGTLVSRKLNVGQLLPITTDLKKLNEYIDTETEIAKKAFNKEHNIQTWTRLASLILSRIILFNKRRSGEASKMTLEQYSLRPIWYNESTEELKNSLTSYEKQLAERLTVVNIVGKRGQKVPVILTPVTKECIDLLLMSRNECGISATNPYVFARGGQSILNIRGHDCLRKIIAELGTQLQQPNYITGTKLRKYVATVCQIFSLSDNEHDWLARHLGHDIRVHREFYRLHENTVELTKISRLLMAVDKGEASKFSGKRLADIEIEELPALEEDYDDHDDDDEEEDDDGIDKKVDGNGDKVKGTPNEAVQNAHASMLLTPETLDFTVTKNKSKYKKKGIPTVKSATAAHFPNKGVKQPWRKDEKEAVYTYFKIHIRKGVVPKKEECVQFQEKHSNLSYRKWSDIKFCVKNQSKKCNIQPTG